MKKSLLLMMMCVPAVLAAQTQNGVEVLGLAVDAGTVTFNVSWTAGAVSGGKVWVFVDHNKNGVMERLPVTGGSVSPSGSVVSVPGNTDGVWVNGGDSFSGTVTLLFNPQTAVAGACAYASGYPPEAEYTGEQTIHFTGTPPYDLVLSSGTITVYSDYNLLPGETLVSFTDKTGAPGIIKCVSSTVYDLKVSATDFCTGGSVTFALSNTTTGRTYQLYKDGGAVMNVLPGTGGAATFTGTFAGAGDYTAQVDADAEHCQAVMNGSHTVIGHALPSITIDGDANQTVDQNSPITTITFTAGNGATAISHSGNLPAGVTGANQSSLVYTIIGTPSVAGAFSYTIIATGAGGCTATTIGTLTVKQIGPFTISETGGPNTALSEKTWTIGSQTWSDVITNVSLSGCSPATNFSTTCGDASRKYIYYETPDAVSRLYVSNACMRSNLARLCPSASGWRVPTAADFETLIAGLAPALSDKSASIYAAWGFHGYYWGTLLMNWDATLYSWSQSDPTPGGIHPVLYATAKTVLFSYDCQSIGMEIRCVK